MGRLIAVGDIHGCAQTLCVLLERLDLGNGDSLLTTGDLSSKGGDSRGVHQQLIDLESQGVNLIPLLGNHELMLLSLQRFMGAPLDLSGIPSAMLRDAEIEFLMRSNGTWATLKSYGFENVDSQDLWAFDGSDPMDHFRKVRDRIVDMAWQLPPHHLALLSRCRTHHIARNCLFVHAGLHPDYLQMNDAKTAVQAQLQTRPKDLCWNRDWLGMTPKFPELLVHGHTPLFYLYSRLTTTDPWKDDEFVFKSVVHERALNLDSGVFLESGHLTAVDIPDDGDPREIQFIRVPRIDPVEKDRLWYVNHMS